MRPGDLLVTALVGHAPTGAFGERGWPLHVTVVAWFRTPTSGPELAKQLTEQLQDIEPFTVTMGGETHLGYGGQALVNLVQLPSPFMDIQRRTVALLEVLDTDFVTGKGTWMGDYRPHVTVQRGGRFQEGDQWICDRLYVVESTAQGNRVVGEALLGKRDEQAAA